MDADLCAVIEDEVLKLESLYAVLVVPLWLGLGSLTGALVKVWAGRGEREYAESAFIVTEGGHCKDGGGAESLLLTDGLPSLWVVAVAPIVGIVGLRLDLVDIRQDLLQILDQKGKLVQRDHAVVVAVRGSHERMHLGVGQPEAQRLGRECGVEFLVVQTVIAILR